MSEQRGIWTKAVRGAFTALVAMAVGGAVPRALWAQATLENPPVGSLSFQSGIGVISGWVCQASRVDIAIDGGSPAQAAYGTSRNDTRQACGDDGNNGFGLLFNWNLLGDGPHTLVALADNVEFARVEFVVARLGTDEFLRGASGEFTESGFPQSGQSVTLLWQESMQNFAIKGDGSAGGGGSGEVARARLENPRLVD